MKIKNYFTIALLLLTVFSNAQNPVFEWGNVAKGEGSKDLTIAKAVTDGAGNTYTIGSFLGFVIFDSSTSLTESGARHDLYIKKTNVVGNLVWVKQIEADLEILAKSLALDAAGNIIIVGTFNGNTDFDPSTTTQLLNSIGLGNDIFVLKLDSNGNYVWVKNFGNSSELNAEDVTIDSQGNILFVGSLKGNLNFGLGNFAATNFVVGTMIVIKMNSLGVPVWGHQVDDTTTSFALGKSIKTDVNNNVFVGGYFSGALRFKMNGLASDVLTAQGTSDVFFLKLAGSNGLLSYVKQIGGISADLGSDLILDADSNIILSGIYKKVADFDPSAAVFNLTNNVNTSILPTYDVFVAKYNPTGDFIWAKSFGNNDNDFSRDIKTDSNNNIYLLQNFTGTQPFVPTSAELKNGSLTKLDNLGNLIWEKKWYGDTDDINISELGIDNAKHLYISGSFKDDSLDLDPDAGVFNVTSSSKFNTFELKLGQGALSNDSFSLNNNFQIAPNPTDGDFSIIISNGMIGGNANIYDLLGKKVQNFKLSSSPTSSKLSSGIYIVEVEVDGKASSKKLIVK